MDLDGAQKTETRLLHAGLGWTISAVTCRAGPSDRPFEERHDGYTIAAVIDGVFDYHGADGRAPLRPGGFLLGNHGCTFACNHPDSAGDCCVALNLSEELFGEIAQGRSTRPGFPTARLPAQNATLPMHVRLATSGHLSDSMAVEELVLGVVGATLSHVEAGVPECRQPADAAERRLGAVARFMEAHSSEMLSLTQLSGMAGMTRFHFLRRFNQAFGMTPHQYVLHARLREAAKALAEGAAPVSTVAYDAGFGDLSTFNARFRRHFRLTPTAFRQFYKSGSRRHLVRGGA
jgi:AraC family transcriptional regulator